MRNRPAYALTSVDNALLLIHMLRDEGVIRVSDAADALDCGRSTAHRLLSMLVYRDFAVRDDNNRTYLPGAALTARPLSGRNRRQGLRRVLIPHLERLCEKVSESVNLMVRVGTYSRFLATIESRQALRVSDRQGTTLPAHKSSGGKALLAELTDSQLANLYLQSEGQASGAGDQILTTENFDRLLRELHQVHRKGYALNLEATETGICAIGRAVRDPEGIVVAAISIAAPTVRFPKRRIDSLFQALKETTEQATKDLPAIAPL